MLIEKNDIKIVDGLMEKNNKPPNDFLVEYTDKKKKLVENNKGKIEKFGPTESLNPEFIENK